jgi:hypothetical protein
MATPSLNSNGIFLRDTVIKNFGSHLDSQHMAQMLKNTSPDDFGPVDFWVMKQKVEAPIYSMAAFGGKNTRQITDLQGRFKWSTPVVTDLPYITGDPMSSVTTKGADGLPFQIQVNKRAWGHGEIITYDKYNGKECVVTHDPIIRTGDSYIYTVKMLSNSQSDYLDNTYLASGTKWFSVGSAMGEYDQKYNDMGEISGGNREYYNFVGQAWASQSLGFTSQADAIAKGYINANGTIPVTELWRCYDPKIDPSIANIDSLVKTMGAEWVKKAKANGTLSRTFLTKMEGVCLSKIARDIETQCMWGKGGKIQNPDGAGDIRLSVGLWKQLDNNYKRIYNKGTFTLDLFKTEIFNYFNGKVEWEGPESGRILKIKTGMGGMKLVNEAVKNAGVNSGFVINATEIGAINASRGSMNLQYGFAFDSIKIPFVATCYFELSPAFDNVHNNDIENPIIDGFPLSSYSFLINDVTDQEDGNIQLIQHPEHQLKWFYQNGDTDYMGSTSGFQSNGLFSGYKVYMKQRHKSIWVKDSSKLLKIVMKNPVNGSSL